MSLRLNKKQTEELVRKGILDSSALSAFDGPQSYDMFTPSDKPTAEKEKKKRSKYNNSKIYEYEDGFISGEKDVCGHGRVSEIYDSKKEYERWLILQSLKKSGAISGLKRQVKYVLQPKFVKDGKTIREIAYIADFEYVNHRTGKTVVEDVKGGKATQTKEFLIKMKLLIYQYPEIEFIIR